MHRFPTLVLAVCLGGALAAQQAQPQAAGTLWISAGEPARLIVNGELAGLVDRLRVVTVPLGRHVVRVVSIRESDVALEQTVVVSSDQPVAVSFNLNRRVNELQQARAIAGRRFRDERAAGIGRFSVKVTDTETGLEWAGHDSGGLVGWTSATTFCESLVIGDADDWRLPTVEQLEALLASVSETVMEENWSGQLWHPVPGVRASQTRFWSSSRANTATAFIDPIAGREIRRPSIAGAFSVDFGSTERSRILHSDVEARAGSALCVRP